MPVTSYDMAGLTGVPRQMRPDVGMSAPTGGPASRSAATDTPYSLRGLNPNENPMITREAEALTAQAGGGADDCSLDDRQMSQNQTGRIRTALTTNPTSCPTLP